MEQALERMAFESRQRDQAREEAEMSAFRQQLWDVERRVMQAEMQSAIAREQATLAQVLAAEAVRSAASAQAEDAIDPWAGVAFFDPGFFWRDRPPPAGPAEQKTAPWGRYSVEQRLGPQGRPIFGFRGGALAAPSPREQTRR
jgi:hypothetical protein